MSRELPVSDKEESKKNNGERCSLLSGTAQA
jgi:hypothetical protein